MNKKSTFLAILMAFAPAFALADLSHHHRLASAVLNTENASYMVITGGTGVHVTTFDYGDAAKTCKFLQSKGVAVINVTNYAESEENGGIGSITEKSC